MNKIVFNLFGGLSLILLSLSSWARPEYAVKHHINRCTTCHVSPVGGGLRTVNGKQYGSHTYRGSKFSQQDQFSLDMRALFIQPEEPTGQSGGLGIMAASAGANIEVMPKQDGSPEMRVVYEHLLSGFQAGARDAYVRFKYYEDSETSWAPQYFLVGQFHVPFGLVTDEHETYTKQQTASTWNNFEMGLLMSGNPSHYLHWDLSLANGERDGGGRGTGRALLWGATLNLRYLPKFFPILMGASYSSHKRKNDEPSPTATALYTMIPLNILTGHLAQGTFSLEYAEATHWNDNITSTFISDTSYRDLVKTETSSGLLAKIEYEMTPRFFWTYQYEALTFNKSFPDDAFTRQSYGVKYWAASNTSLIGRFTQSSAQAPSETDSTKRSNVDAIYLVLQTSI